MPTDDEMRFRVYLECDNAAFAEDMRGEISSVLRDIAQRVEGGEDCSLFRSVYDSNGNVCGTFALKPKSAFD